MELHIVDRASDSTIERALKKHASAPSPTVLGHPAQGQQRVRSGDGRRAGRLHAATAIPTRPLLCLDETSKQLLAETRATIPMKPGRPARCDYEYERNGTANLFMLFAPLEGWRHVKVTDRHTAVDYAHLSKDVADIHFSAAETLVLVQQNLLHPRQGVHSTKPFQPPKPDGWSSDLSGTTRQSTAVGSIGGVGTQRPIVPMPRSPHPRQTNPLEEVAAWEQDRNVNHDKANWHFTTPKARIKLKHLPVNLTELGD